MSDQALIQVRNLERTFGGAGARVQALRGVSMEVAAAEFLAVMGPSGSGKSTLLHLIGGLDIPDGGEVHIDGQSLGELSDNDLTLFRRKRIGFVFQAFNLLDVLTAVENVALPLEIGGQGESDAHQQALDALAWVKLEERADHVPGALSGGQQQRLAIARSLVTKPLVLLADEPTGNLDSTSSDQIVRLLRDLATEKGQTIVMVTHNPRHAAMADRVVELHDGRLRKEHRASPSQFLEGLRPLS